MTILVEVMVVELIEERRLFRRVRSEVVAMTLGVRQTTVLTWPVWLSWTAQSSWSGRSRRCSASS